MTIKQDKKSGKFVEGNRPAGRPKGARNKLKISDVLADCDKNSPDAIAFLIEIMNGNVKGASITSRQSAAVKIIDLAFRNKIELEKASQAIDDLNGSDNQEEEDDSPSISLTALK